MPSKLQKPSKDTSVFPIVSIPSTSSVSETSTSAEVVQDSLFEIEPQVLPICPTKTLNTALKIATKILRSDVYQETLSTMFTKKKDNSPHIKKEELKELLSVHRRLFIIDKIRSIHLLGARSATRQEYDPWKVYLNPLLLLEMQDREREKDLAEKNDSGINLQEKSQEAIKTAALKCEEVQDTKETTLKRKHAELEKSDVGEESVSEGEEEELLNVGSAPYKPSDLTPQEKHEATHLINYHFRGGKGGKRKFITPKKKMKSTHLYCFHDLGHMIEYSPLFIMLSMTLFLLHLQLTKSLVQNMSNSLVVVS